MKTSFYFLLMYVFVFSACGQNKAINLASNGKTDYSIILPKNATYSEIKAAKQLKIYLDKITSATFRLSDESRISASQSKKFIFIGNTAYASAKIPRNDLLSLKDDAIVLKAINQNIILTGEGARGTVYAVYDFLENYLGCRWWTPFDQTIPANKNVILQITDKIYTPQLNYRSHYSYNSLKDAEFAASLRENGDNIPVDSTWGGKVQILGWVHTFSTILPPGKYFKIHPEWYSDPNNQFKPCTKNSVMPEAQSTQLCLSNKLMQKEFLANTLKWIKENPTYDIISVSQNDNWGYCKCANDQRIIDEEGSPSGLVLRFVNMIATEVAKTYPRKKIETLSYLFSEKPPKITRPVKNVIIRFAPIDSDFGYSLDNDRNKSVRDNLLEWAKISKDNFYWGYNTNINLALLPHPSLVQVKNDFQFLIKNNFKGVFIQDNTNPEGYGYFTNMDSWIMGHLMWNPSLNYDVLVDEFMNGYYGDAGPFLKNYYLLIQNSFLARKSKLSTFNTDFSFITNDVIQKGSILFEKAALAVRNNKILLARVRREKISFDYTQLYLYSKLQHNGYKVSSEVTRIDYDKKVGEFFRSLDTFVITDIFVRNALAQYKIRLKSDLDAVYQRDLSGDNFTIQQDEFDLYKNGEISGIIDDNYASDKKAANIIGSSNAWAVRIMLKDVKKELSGNEWGVASFLKIARNKNKTNNSASNISFGVYDLVNKKAVVTKNIALGLLDNDNYQKIELGNMKLSKNYMIWFAVDAKNEEVLNLYIDRVEMKKIK